MVHNNNQKELAKTVHCVADVTIQWNGKEIDLRKGATLAYGIVEYWEKRLGIEFEKTEISPTPIPDRTVENPLAELGRGDAFTTLKEKRRQTRGGE